MLDADVARFDQLGAEFRGRTVQGFSFDRGACGIGADIVHADAFVATTQSDNEKTWSPPKWRVMFTRCRAWWRASITLAAAEALRAVGIGGHHLDLLGRVAH